MGKINRAQLSMRAQAQLARYHGTGDPVLLAKSVRLFQQALDAAPSNHPNRSMYLVNLSTVLMLSSSETEDSADLLDAVGMLREAVAVTRSGHRYRAGYLANLGEALNRLYDKTGDLGLLEEALQAYRDSLAATSQFSPRRAGRLLKFSLGLWTLFEQTGDLDALAEAIQGIRESAAAAPMNSVARASRLAVLGMSLYDLFEEGEDLDVLREAVSALRESVAGMPARHMSRDQLLPGLAFGLMALHEHLGEEGALREAKGVWAEVADSDSASADLRVLACWGLGWAAILEGDARVALAAYERAIAVLPQVVPRRLATPDRRRQLGLAGGLAAGAAAAAVAVGRPERAVELLEQARGILLGEAMGARSDLTELQALDETLAAEFERLRDDMGAVDRASPDPLDYVNESPASGAAGTGTTTRTAAHDEARRVAGQRRRLAMKWEDLLAQIRAVPGMETFLQPAPIERLRRQASEGPVVFVNVSDYRCDALILTADAGQPIHVVPLPGVTRKEVILQAHALDEAVNMSLDGSAAERVQDQQKLSGILAWLWDEITEPVLDNLGFSSAPTSSPEWPRIWWCPVAEMALLPLHAAGYYGDIGRAPNGTYSGRAATVLDRVVSSYIPTIRALEYARDNYRHASTGKESGGALIVAMPVTPLAHALPGAQAEADLLTRLIPASRVLAGARATRENVLAALPHHRIAHFSCHGLSDRANPASSRLLLNDHTDSPLTVTNLSALRLTGTELAFLSACSTSDTSRDLVDESVHITAAFQLAGYQNVVGTLWPVLDRAAAMITEEFYTQLTNNGSGMAQPPDIAHVMHDAVRKLRELYPSSPGAWAGFIHAGM